MDTLRLPADAHINDDGPSPFPMENALQAFTGSIGLIIAYTF